ncbi:MAG: tripartite tricarboxylate transporter permease [Candidatus Pacebacteria bacterium]|nr:tripartite tricarboxylate transporter permease [Candidatus Paceibacterota bacterium]
MSNFLTGISYVFEPATFLVLACGVFGGIIIGALPGLTSTMGVALLLPITYSMDEKVAIVMLLGIYCGAIYGGSISAILLKTPGTPASAATILDGHPMALRGEAGRALGISTVSSSIGGLISGIFLILISPLLASFALKFGGDEYFALAVFGLSIIVSMSGKHIMKGLSAAFLGLLIATIGIDDVTSVARFTFGSTDLLSGVSLIPAMIGLFAVSEGFLRLERSATAAKVEQKKIKLLPSRSDFKKLLPTAIRGSVIGTVIGAIPGTGGDIAAFVSYNVAQKISRKPEEFGTGCVQGIAASESANNGTTGGTLIPLLTLGVPGDSTTAVLLGALTLQGLACGPMLFTNHSDLIYSIYVGFMSANVLLLILGLLLMRVYIRALSVHDYFITPAILILCVVGAFAINKSYFDLISMFVFGVLGYFLTKLEVPLSPIVLAIILGPLAEKNFRRALMISHGSFEPFYTSPITMTLFAITLIALIVPPVVNMIQTKREKKKKQADAQGLSE